MKNGMFKIGRVFGIDVRVHWTFFLLLFYFAFVGYQRTGNLLGALATTGIIVALFVDLMAATDSPERYMSSTVAAVPHPTLL